MQKIIFLFISTIQLTLHISPISYEVTHSISVFQKPSASSRIVGRIIKGARFAILKKYPNKHCKNGFFVKVGKKQYICNSYLKESLAFPVNKPIPFMHNLQILPFRFKKITIKTSYYTSINNAKVNKIDGFFSSNTYLVFKKQRFKKINNRLFLLNTRDLVIPYDNFTNIEISKFRGVFISNGKPQYNAIVTNNKGARIYSFPGIPDYKIPKLSKYTWLILKSPYKNKKINNIKYFMLNNKTWFKENDIKRFYFNKSPSFINTTNKIWIEVILSQQTMVVYKENTPIFMTLVSTAKKGYKTQTGIFMIYYKKGYQTLSLKRKNTWSFYYEYVPYLQFISGNLAIHTAYWHNQFGNITSMGCIELSPFDAHYLYNLTLPHVPNGFIAYSTNKHQQGTIIKIVKYPQQQVKYRGLVYKNTLISDKYK